MINNFLIKRNILRQSKSFDLRKHTYSNVYLENFLNHMKIQKSMCIWGFMSIIHLQQLNRQQVSFFIVSKLFIIRTKLSLIKASIFYIFATIRRTPSEISLYIFFIISNLHMSEAKAKEIELEK
ncbi:unnamed protein product [Paramecium sonneborni]|uniref:Uncharacterized protein n=1 Tax=Paramecium sonneborni TaxID=65129 RepID=A0A8S1PAC4_9CILI|nr:unnamed protein product [Paramecium sonneborni]